MISSDQHDRRGRGSGPAVRRRPSLRRTRHFSRVILLMVLSLVAVAAGCTGASEPGSPGERSGPAVEITDVLGRHVTVKAPSARILVDGSRLLYTTSLLDKQNPVRRIVGWPKDLLDNDPGTYQTYLRQFPQLAGIPTIGELYDGSFSVEQAIALRPDVFVASASAFKTAQDAGVIDRLGKVGIPTVFIDYFVDPIKNTVPSVELMGALLDRKAEAANFIAYYRSAVDGVRSRLDAAKQPATATFLWRAPGYFDCCSSFARSNLAAIVNYAGGENLADDLLPGQQGSISPETVLSRNPQVVIATGANWAPNTPAKPGSFVPLGYDQSPARAQAQLRAIIDRQAGFSQLGAVQQHRTYAVWHHFYDSPYNFLAIQWFAKWMHPDLFADVDPDAGLRALHEKFLPVPVGGAFWAELS
ncbi:ABC transporter substrate-binding protein [Nocardia sp. NEAU-G5]|uniref:ABC transporter substrate-binding protein n=1 Tax=Nocardia albiluteola TaxID=2842303 RepID=A0ABS6AXA0_9NOCA|nr:ABC transporter substrate-binding protein [Nocardia albiluteola]MBU3062513.1 ABC transporter substrate-binding protein [Nocardia albiluteola]MBU3065653.1 ABC transporter substrate-binding protein [Nocardia albiluteola]